MNFKKHFGARIGVRTAGAATGLLFLAASLGVPAAFAAAPPSQAGLVIKNYWNHDMTFNIADTEYTVPADGQLTIVLPSGDYTFSSSVEGDDSSGRSGDIALTTGEKVDLSFAATVPNYYESVESSVVSGTTTSIQPPTTQPSATQPAGSQPATTQPSTAPAGSTGIVVKNYWSHDMSFNINDTENVVPANGQLFISLPAGEFTFSSNVEGDDTSPRSGDLTIAAGQKIDLSFAATVPAYYQSVEAAVATGGSQSAQSTTPSTGTTQPATSQPSSVTPGQTGVLVKNFWGAPLTFNVSDTEYVVPASGQLFIALPAGDYTFSASVPDNDQSGFNGPLTIAAGKTVVLNSYLNSQYIPLTQ